MSKKLTPGIIREFALDILKNQTNGIKQSELIAATSSVLEANGYTIPKEYTVRNALWDLDEKYPDSVEKHSLGKRNAIYTPRLSPPPIVAEKRAIYETVSGGDKTRQLKLRIQAFLLDYSTLVEDNRQVLDSLWGMDPDAYPELSRDEIEALHNVRIAYQIMDEAGRKFFKGGIKC